MKNIIICVFLLITISCQHTSYENEIFLDRLSKAGINQEYFSASSEILLFPSNYCTSCGENFIKNTTKLALSKNWCIVVTGLIKAEVDYAATKFSADLKIIKDYNGIIANSISKYRDKPLLIEMVKQNIVGYKDY